MDEKQLTPNVLDKTLSNHIILYRNICEEMLSHQC